MKYGGLDQVHLLGLQLLLVKELFSFEGEL